MHATEVDPQNKLGSLPIGGVIIPTVVTVSDLY
jgi:hypothetical protein